MLLDILVLNLKAMPLPQFEFVKENGDGKLGFLK
jgi:hypothetical protein